MSVRHKNLKYLTIERLETIRANSYRSSCGQYEYQPEFIDNELNRKYSERDERNALAELESYEIDDSKEYIAYKRRLERQRINELHEQIDALWLARLLAEY